jgi:hypothetical protein
MTRPAALLAFALAACASRPGPAAEPVAAPAPTEVGVQVENHFAGSLTIYLDVNGVGRRLGQVNMQDTRAFVIPWRRVVSGIFRLRAEVIGSDERVVTPDLRVQPGQLVRWTLAPSLSMSSVAFF